MSSIGYTHTKEIKTRFIRNHGLYLTDEIEMEEVFLTYH
jgi:hypothetical protein